jgi:hypothetical protein
VEHSTIEDNNPLILVALGNFAKDFKSSFSPLISLRKHMPVKEDFYLHTFMGLWMDTDILLIVIITIVVLAILLDSFTPGMHRKCELSYQDVKLIVLVFELLYVFCTPFPFAYIT